MGIGKEFSNRNLSKKRSFYTTKPFTFYDKFTGILVEKV
jgi:hypothetical protein